MGAGGLTDSSDDISLFRVAYQSGLSGKKILCSGGNDDAGILSAAGDLQLS